MSAEPANDKLQIFPKHHFMTSLRTKVFLGVITGLLLVILAAEIVVYRQAVAFAERELFQKLRKFAGALEEVVYIGDSGDLRLHYDWESRIRLGNDDRAEFFEFKDMNDDFLLDSHNLGGDSLPNVGGHHNYELVDYGNIFLGIYENHFTKVSEGQNDQQYKLLVADNTDLIAEARETAIRNLMIFTPLAIIAALIMSFGLTAIALSSISRFRARVQSLSATDSKSQLDLNDVDREIKPLGVALNKYIDHVNQHIVHESRLLAETAHELRIPLANMRTELDDLSDDYAKDPVLNNALEKIESNVTGLQRMTENMLLLYRIESGKYLPRVSLMDLKEVLELKTKGIFAEGGPTVELHGESATVCSNRSVIGIIVAQLVHNACQYAPGSKVSINWQKQDDRILLHVDDSGPGIPEEERERIFERMYRFEDLNQPQSSGSGLGLALVRLYAESVEAFTQCTESPTAGARFSISLPCSCPTQTDSV